MNIMKKKWGIFMAAFTAASMMLGGSINASAALNNIETSYSTVTEVFDFGPSITKVIVDLDSDVSENLIDSDTFNVHVVRTEKRKSVSILGEKEGDCKVLNAYVSDENGVTKTSGEYVTLELEVGPTISLTSQINYDPQSQLNGWIDCNFTITQQKDIKINGENISGLVIDKCAGGTKEIADNFNVGSWTDDNVTLKYASYVPDSDSTKRPLIIWLHGMGEGGSDGLLSICGNKVVNFATEDIQSYFNGAYILAPQAPTYWMDGFTGFGDGTSKYENALMSLIKDYVSKNSNIDTNRIYIGGDSNGGYMTMLMVRDYSDYFAAAFPTCEALKDTLITDQDIEKLKKTPIWFTAAKTDTVVSPEEYVVPTYKRLIESGANNIHFSYFDNVIDTTGLYKNDDGTPYEYMGHFSWVYVYNDHCVSIVDGKVTTIMEWVSNQELNKPRESGSKPISLTQTITIS